MEFKGTKGKWKTKYVQGYIRIVDDCENNVIDTPWKHLNESNALLISKAPEMLEMLIEIKEQIQDGRTYITKEEIEKLIKEATEL